ncbi:MAG: hypothetical protein HUU50_05395 [Candidatus Brocadiae bacterium]|nr:hypothetical protein [Candidatus Brocadiia bacterium]
MSLSVPSGYSEKGIKRLQEAYQKMAKRMVELSGFYLVQRPSIVLCLNHEEMLRLAQGDLPEWALGMAIPEKFLVAINLSKVDMISNNLYAVIRHEVCHLYLGAWEQAHQKMLPLWFNEGIAQWVSGALHWTYQEDILESIALRKTMPFSSLKSKFPKSPGRAKQAYLQSRSMVGYIVENYGTNGIKYLLSAYSTCPSFEDAVEKTLGIDFATLQSEWKSTITPVAWWFWIWQLRHLFSLFTAMAFLVLVAYILQKKKSKKIFAAWKEEEIAAMMVSSQASPIKMTIVRDEEEVSER